jgi:hypothetical protein
MKRNDVFSKESHVVIGLIVQIACHLKLLFLILLVAFTILPTQQVFAEELIDSAEIEKVMRDFQSIFHYVAVVEDDTPFYVSWPKRECKSCETCKTCGSIFGPSCLDAPSYPINFYGLITESEADTLVKNIKDTFYSWSAISSTVGLKFLDGPLDDQPEISPLYLTGPADTATRDEKLSQIKADIEKLKWYYGGYAYIADYATDYIEKYGYGEDSFSENNNMVADADWNIASGDAIDMWEGSSDNSFSGSNVYVRSTMYHSENVNYTPQAFVSKYIAKVATCNYKLSTNLSNHAGNAKLYLRIKTVGEDGSGSSLPTGVAPDNLFHCWDNSVSVDAFWTSNYLFSGSCPTIELPQRITSQESDNVYDKKTD